MKDLLNKLEQNEYQSFNIGENTELEFVNKSTFDEAQQGFRKNEKNDIEEWAEIVGDEFYVIGFTSALGDPIIANTKKPEFPIHYLFNDSWNSAPIIANSFDEFIQNLQQLDNLINVQFASRAAIRKAAKDLDKKYNTLGFYQALCFEVIDKDGCYYEDFRARD